MENIFAYFRSYFENFYIAVPGIRDIIEIAILSLAIYKVMQWFMNSRAWTLLKGVVIILLFMVFAAVLRLNTILYILKNAFSVGIIAIIILFQPELRRGLEELGKKKLSSYLSIKDTENLHGLTDKTIYEIVKTATALSATRTGALIVIENEISLQDFVDTGISVDAIVTNQLLVNIFEHNTPLHDGAVIIRNNRVEAATCYLPLSDNNDINKELGTRHRAGIGVSEMSDSITVIVSEETGSIAVAKDGQIYRNLDAEALRKFLFTLHREEGKRTKEDKKVIKIRKHKGGKGGSHR